MTRRRNSSLMLFSILRTVVVCCMILHSTLTWPSTIHGFTTTVSTRGRCFQMQTPSSSGTTTAPSLTSSISVSEKSSASAALNRLRYSGCLLSAVASSSAAPSPSSSVSQEEEEQPGDTNTGHGFPYWPWKRLQQGGRRGFRTLDDLDKRLISQTIPVIASFAATPIIGAVDLFWINQMGSPLAVAGQAAANAMFSTLFWATSFLPSVAATLIANENAQSAAAASKNKKATTADGTTTDNDETTAAAAALVEEQRRAERVQDSICQSLFVSILLAIMAKICLFRYSTPLLSMILPSGAPALQYAKPYLYIRAFGFLPSIISLVSYAAFRGVQDNVTPVKISILANVINAILDPIFIFTCRMGVSGAAVATLIAETVSAVLYLTILRRRRLIKFAKIFKLPSWSALSPLIRGGAALQLRNLSMNLTFLMVARVAQGLDATGVAAAAHALAIQAFQVGGIVLLALSTVSQTVIPTDLVERFETVNTTTTNTATAATTSDATDNKLQQVTTQQQVKKVGGIAFARNSSNRLMSWSFVLSIVLGFCQLASLPLIRSSTPSKAVRDAAYIPTILASILTLWNGPVFVGEGIMIGTSSFLRLSLGTVVATIGCVSALSIFPPIYGITGVWMSFFVFNTIRLVNVWIHQRINGPLAPRNVNKEGARSEELSTHS